MFDGKKYIEENTFQAVLDKKKYILLQNFPYIETLFYI